MKKKISTQWVKKLLPAGGITGGTGTSFCLRPNRNTPPFFLTLRGELKLERICNRIKNQNVNSVDISQEGTLNFSCYIFSAPTSTAYKNAYLKTYLKF